MLGLIAIIYSFVQSISQSTSVVEIREQVERLIVAGNEITESGKIIHCASQEVNGLVGDLASKVIENTSTTKEVLGSVSKLTSELNFSQSMQPRDSIEDGADASDDIKTTSILGSDRTIVFLMIICIYEGAKRGYTIDQVESLILPTLSTKYGVDINFIIGAFNTTLFAIEAEKHTDFSEKNIGDEVIKVSDEFNQIIRERIPETMSGDNLNFNKFWQTINELNDEQLEPEKP